MHGGFVLTMKFQQSALQSVKIFTDALQWIPKLLHYLNDFIFMVGSFEDAKASKEH